MGSRPSRVRTTVAPLQIEATQSEGSPREGAFGEEEVQSAHSVSSGDDTSPADSGSEFGVVAENFQIYKVELLEEKLAEAEGRLKDAEGRNRRADQAIAELEAQLKAASLFSQAESEKDMFSQSSPSVVLRERSRSADAKQQFIHRLKSELEASQKELSVTRERYEKRLHKMKSASAQSRAESALVMFELREQCTRLKEENSLLLDKIHQLEKEKAAWSPLPEASRACSSAAAVGMVSPLSQEARMDLVLDLSQQVSTLNEELEKARERIAQLEQGRGSQPAQTDPLESPEDQGGTV